MKQVLLTLLKQHKTLTMADLIASLQKDRTAIYRQLKSLIQSGEVIMIKKGVYALSITIEQYFDTPVRERKPAQYRPELLHTYIPNETFFLSLDQRKKLRASVHDPPLDTDFYKNNKKLLETLLIDLSYASSYLEGNTYSYLDTEVLLKYNEINKEKTKEETQMILNHKKAIEYLIYYHKQLGRNKKTICEIHTLLGDGLLPATQLGIIRNAPVEIGQSAYKPLEMQAPLEDELTIFLQKLSTINNPFEQSLFIMVFLPYFQLFHDINKRTSRILANLPLVKQHLPVLSLIQLEKKKYITAILSVYELQKTAMLAQLWTENYLLNLPKYKRLRY